MVKPWMVKGLALGLAASVARMVSAEARRRRDRKNLKEDVQVWEGEGGQVPGATLGAPATKPTADHPMSNAATT
jgi:hypothetical protein